MELSHIERGQRENMPPEDHLFTEGFGGKWTKRLKSRVQDVEVQSFLKELSISGTRSVANLNKKP